MPRDTLTGVGRPADSELPIGVLVRPYRRRWRLVLATVVIAWIGALAAVFIPARRYTASIVLAAVPDARGGTVIERVLDERGSDIKPTQVEPAMRDKVEAEVDKQTGLITIKT